MGIPEGALPLPGLLFGAPVLLSLVLALALVALVTWKRRRRRPGAPFLKVQNPAPDGESGRAPTGGGLVQKDEPGCQ